MAILILTPLFKQRIWGGSYFKQQINPSLDDQPYGEMWSLSAHKQGETIIENGSFQGKTLNEIFLSHPELFNCSAKEFPLMVKLIQTEDDLSVQVHPDDEFAAMYEDQLGKTECWYFLDAKPGARIVLGHLAKTKDEMEQAIKDGKCENYLSYQNIKPNDFALINSKTVHALGKGLLLLEIQQSSDVTYRLYDYNRLGLDGKKRPLHIEKALKVIDFPQKEWPIITNHNNELPIEQLTNCPYFSVDLLKINGEANCEKNENQFLIITSASNNISINGTNLSLGKSCIVTCGEREIKIKGHGEVLITASNN